MCVRSQTAHQATQAIGVTNVATTVPLIPESLPSTLRSARATHKRRRHANSSASLVAGLPHSTTRTQAQAAAATVHHSDLQSPSQGRGGRCARPHQPMHQLLVHQPTLYQLRQHLHVRLYAVIHLGLMCPAVPAATFWLLLPQLSNPTQHCIAEHLALHPFLSCPAPPI